MTTGDTGMLRRGTAEYRRASAVLFLAGFLTYAMLYVVQGLLPAISDAFDVAPATSALALSLTTLPIAVGVLVAASWSERRGRRGLLIGSLVGATVLTLASAASQDFAMLLGVRVLTGVALAGFPAVAMAYVAEEFHPSGLGTAMGLYISGTGLGGMAARVAGGLVAGATSWRVALTVLGVLCLVGTTVVALRLPPSRHFSASDPASGSGGLGGVFAPMRDPVIVRLMVCGFVLMGSLVSYYNFLQYRLARPPYELSATAVPWIFLLYLCGTLSSNWMGRMTDRRNRRGVMAGGLVLMAAGAVMSLARPLPVVLIATAVIIFGFFGAHSVASGFVGAYARSRRAPASALYLFGYHLGSSLAGFVGGLFFGAFGWGGEVGTVLALVFLGGIAVSGLPTKSDRRPGPDGRDGGVVDAA